MKQFLLFAASVFFMSYSVVAQNPVDWNKLFGKNWKISEASILRPTRPDRGTSIEFSRGKPSLFDLDKIQTRFEPDGTYHGFTANGSAKSGTWKFEGQNSIWIEGDDKPSQVTKLTDTELIIQIPQVYGSVFGDSDEFVISQYKFFSDDALPVKLSFFTAQNLEGKNVLLIWKTTSEINVDRFEVEHSNDAKNFIAVGQVKALSAGNQDQSYSFVHSGINSSVANYYRLMMIDKDGTFAYSSIQSVNGSGAEKEKIYPNPVLDEINIEAKNWASIQSTSIHDLAGKQIQKHRLPERKLNIKALPAGTYLLLLEYKDGNVSAIKFVKG